MAIDLITGHQGQLHISAEQIATLNNAALNGFGDHKVLRMVDGAVSYSGLAISVGTGYWRVNGFDMEIYESENVYIDPSTIGTSRIDRVFVEILQDIPSGVQRSELVVVMGEESANTPIAPDAPTDPELNTDLMLQCEEVCVATVTEGAMTLSDSTIAFNVVTPAELATVDTKVDNALGMIQKSSDAYSDSSPYKVGDYVIHDNKVYICTTACVAGSWATNSGYFTETSLTTAVTGLNSALTDVDNDLRGIIGIKETQKTVNVTVGAQGITFNIPTYNGYYPFLAIFAGSWGNQLIPYDRLCQKLSANQTTFQAWVEATQAASNVPFTFIVLYLKDV